MIQSRHYLQSCIIKLALIIAFFIILLGLPIIILICAQTPEDVPPAFPPEVSYEIQIGWGDMNFPEFVWEDIPVAEIRVKTTDWSYWKHSYRCRLLNTKNWWIWPSINSTAEKPETIALSIIPTAIRNSKWAWWGYYRIRIKAITIGQDYFIWSQPSNWIQVIDLDYLKKTAGILNGEVDLK